MISQLKTRRFRRTLYLTPQLVELLRRHRARRAEKRLAAGEAWQDHGLVFPSEVGMEGDRRSAAAAMSRALFGQ